MSNQFKIFLRLPTLYNKISQETDVFNDCIIKLDDDTQIPFNRILLAKYSKWFEDYFLQNPKKGPELSPNNSVVVPIHKIQKEHMLSFISILHNNYLQVTVKNLPYLLKIAQDYSFPQISSILRTFYTDAISQNDKHLLHFAKTFIENDLIDDAKVLAGRITKHFINCERGVENEPFSMKEIYESLSPPVFAEVLKERFKQLPIVIYNEEQEQTKKDRDNDKEGLRLFNEDIKKKIKKYSLNPEPENDSLVIKYIEDYVKVRGAQNLTEQDKIDLAAVFGVGKDEGANKFTFSRHLLRYNCDWLPDELARNHINSIIDKRRTCINKLNRSIGFDKRFKNGDTTSRWYVMSLVKTLSDGESSIQEVPLVEFIRTLGGSSYPFNPIEYGFIKMHPFDRLEADKNPNATFDSSAPIINTGKISRKAENAFNSDPSSSFITESYKKQKPFFQFAIDPIAKFYPAKIFFDSRVCFKYNEIPRASDKLEQYKHLKRTTRGLVQILSVQTDSFSQNITFADPTNPTENNFTGNEKPIYQVKFELSANTQNDDIMRVTSFEILGTFRIKEKKDANK